MFQATTDAVPSSRMTESLTVSGPVMELKEGRQILTLGVEFPGGARVKSEETLEEEAIAGKLKGMKCWENWKTNADKFCR